jgi:hypothetical protein
MNIRYLLILVFTFLISCSGPRNPQKPEKDIRDTVQNKNLNSDSIFIHECVYNDLSYTFNFHLKLERIYITKENYDSTIIKVFITEKNTNRIVDSVGITSTFVYIDSIQNCNNVRSYITGKNETNGIWDMDYGILVIADVNFDLKDDIAIVSGIGASTGVMYTFFEQNNNKTFKRDSFLSDSVRFFPQNIDTINRKLSLSIPAGYKWSRQQEFHLNINTNHWEITKDTIIDISN